MVLTDDAVEANPELATQTITLPPAQTLESWTQAGANAEKVVGHIKAAESLSIAWRNNVGDGSSKKSALSTPPVASSTTIFTLDASQQVVATDLATGRTLWREKLKGLSKRDKSALGGGLAVDGDTLIVASGFGYVSGTRRQHRRGKVEEPDECADDRCADHQGWPDLRRVEQQ